ncbi:acetyl-CoA carboxylase carboxyltransferase subunit alpha [Carboxydothermus hydrogenoformans]|uniref:Acetyl-coenzyme A carboxylase carboxyl transferase subunit alpha n=1 Tax=Carboxydothermus hydrogenoformans (strain ATCC BAA-161 / DSM 6008 / Z-2901) TaxID=246194 RepID=ACCA_CARHZ|nr:acetyl-CoA carboxylase carboxyltransferase subunit alpha [Carboxydothermus hydrogenoformans]Q3ACZ7.1 RecName: Full=Acetyl-coenzyme A carboxylase carboxyl transferase subunit alpha; Short=ACCase subunit alpha; Short=Acetyl-CoA carboxylase carboxyltransferase subunit alpha [Carboxydothermus hydrogenoformans Z-2901]ABB15723.1 acetyl-CoA carboxylase, carboxyl transferase, alpha subunit [Carboxydothermus hydrogenoformans Z-2901]
MANFLFEFEKPLVELENKISDLKKFAEEKNIDVSRELELLSAKAQQLAKEIYQNLTPWQRVLLARHPERPNTRDYINYLCDDFIELKGDRRFGDDPAMIGGIGIIENIPVTIVGNLKGKDTKENIMRNFGMAHPEGYRKAIRLFKQAEKFGRPVLTFIDTPGAFCGIGAEERGQFQAIAEAIATLISLKTPVLAVITGEGGSGGALALAAGDKLLMLENAVFSVIAPESFAAILWKDSSRAQEASELLKLTSEHLLEFGLIDGIIPEPLGGAHRNPAETLKAVKEEVVKNLQILKETPVEELLRRRYQRYRYIGSGIVEGGVS